MDQMKGVGVGLLTLLGAIGGLGCRPTAPPSGGPGTDDGSTTVVGEASSGVARTAASRSASAGGSEADDGVEFIQEPDGGSGSFECDPYRQDCEAGFKCAYVVTDGGAAIDGTRCVPVVDDAAGPGEPCTSEDWVAGVDTCAVGAWCWDIDPETGEGMCVSLCGGSADDPTCNTAGETCVTNKTFGVCLPVCHPIEQPCPVGCGCYPAEDGFFCTPDASGPDAGDAGSPCDFVNECSPGFFCANAEVVPHCSQSYGCCTPFCDLTLADPCPAPDLQCVPWYEGGQPIDPILANVGACIVSSAA